MNDIKELVAIISDNGGSATLDTICSLYAEKNKVFISNNHKQVIRETLNSNPDLVKRVDYKENEVYKLVEDEIITFLRKVKKKCSKMELDDNDTCTMCPFLTKTGYCFFQEFGKAMSKSVPEDYNIDDFKNIIKDLDLKKGE